MQQDEFLEIARNYWNIRNSGDVSDRRSFAHDALLDACTKCGIRYIDREHAAQLALQIIKNPDVLETMTSSELRERLCGMLAVQFGHSWSELNAMTDAQVIELVVSYLGKLIDCQILLKQVKSLVSTI